MKVLIISNTPWRMDTGFGNSFSNIFDDIKEVEIANIYCSSGKPDNRNIKNYFQTTEKLQLKHLFNKNKPSGKRILTLDVTNEDNEELRKFDIYRRFRLYSVFFAREMFWKLGLWKSNELFSFVEEFQPNLIFVNVYNKRYIANMNLYLSKKFNLPMVSYISDPNYSLRRLEFHPLFWIDRLLLRRKLKKVFLKSKKIYTISDIQLNEMKKSFPDKEIKILTKVEDFDNNNLVKYDINNPIKLLYAGNIDKGRFKSLSLIAKAVGELIFENKIQLDIYSATTLTKKQLKKFDYKNVFFHGKIPYQELIKKNKEADLPIHVEGLSYKERCKVYQSFSTKIVDYLFLSKPIFSVGKTDCASIKFIKDNKCGFVSQNYNEILCNMKKILENPKIIKEYGENSWDTGKKYCNKTTKLNELLNDLKSIVEEDGSK